MSVPEDKRVYSYADYLAWPEEERIELINGIPLFQAAPSRVHQEILSELHRQIANYLLDKECKVYPAPFHVVLEIGESSKDLGNQVNVFEPDLSIIFDLSKLDDKGCQGNPDMVIEITSPSTARRDKVEKFNKYEQAGIREYWIVEPTEKVVSVYTLQDNHRFGRPDMYTEDDQVKVAIFKDLIIDLRLVFG